MSTREEFAVAIRCPKCGHHGKSIWEETDGANCQHGPQRLLKFVSAGFRAKMPKRSPVIRKSFVTVAKPCCLTEINGERSVGGAETA
jgi:hypothetical protein